MGSEGILHFTFMEIGRIAEEFSTDGTRMSPQQLCLTA